MISFATQNLKSSHIFCLKNKAFTLALPLLLVLLTANWLTTSLSADDSGVFSTKEFEISIPPEFERIEHKQAAIVLRHKTQGYPTFNAVFSPGAWPYSSISVKEQAQKLEDSYRLVGLTTVKLANYSLTTLDQQVTLNAELIYQSSSSNYTSSVWLVSLKDKHLVFTAVYKDQPKPAEIAEIEKILKGIKIHLQANPIAKKESNRESLMVLALIAILSIVGLILIIKWISKRRT